MPDAVNIEDVLAGLTVMEGRTPETPDEEGGDETFAVLAPFDTGAVFTGSFSGTSPWERHTAGDELVHILKGSTEITILSDDGDEVLNLSGGMLTVVPRGCWHRFHAPDGVTVLTATPHPTDHSSAADPRAAE